MRREAARARRARRSRGPSRSRRASPQAWTAPRAAASDRSRSKIRVDVNGVRTEVEDLVEVDASRDLGVGTHELAEVELLLPRAHGMPLHEPVGDVPREPALHQREQQSLAEEQPVTRVDVRPHALGAHDQPLDEPCETVERVVEREEGIRQHDPLRGRVGDVALVPESDVLEPDLRVPAQHARQPADPLRDDRVPLVRHRGRSLLPLAERLLDLPHLGPGEVADLDGEPLERRADQSDRRKQLGMPVPLQDLRRARRRLEPQALAGDVLDLRVDRRVLADRARELADAQALERVLDPHAVPLERERPSRELQPERRRLGVDPVRPAHAERLAMGLGLLDDGTERALQPLEQQRPGFLDRDRQRRVQDIRRGEAEVEPTAVLAERLRHGVDERGDVVIRLALELRDPRGASAVSPRRGSDRRRRRGSTPTAAQPSSAASSTSSILASLASSDQIRVMAGRE